MVEKQQLGDRLMEDTSYARKYRPRNLEGYIGNSRVRESVSALGSKGKLPNVIFLTGFTGCGKTTIARIIAKIYLCPNREGSEPCNDCSVCSRMDEFILTGDFENVADLVEVDVTTDSNKDKITGILSESEYPPYESPYRVVIFDEVHLASDSGQSSMLKVAEEPTETTLYIFATTDPQRVLPTLLNRAEWRLDIQKPTLTELSQHLANVLNKEGVDFDPAGLRAISTRADFVIRESLQLLQQVVGTRGSVTGQTVAKEFAEVTDRQIFTFYKAYLDEDFISYVSLLHVIRTTVGFKQFLISLRAFTTRGLYAVNGVQPEGLSADEIKEYSLLFRQFTPREVAIVLGRLRGLDRGDIETNLMSFIYQQVEPISSDSSEPEGVPEMVEGSTSQEVHGRAAQISAREQLAQDATTSRILESPGMETATAQSMKDVFSFKGVK